MAKPGWKSTELWLGLLAMILTMLGESDLLPSVGPLATAGAAAYAMARAYTKVGERKWDALGKLPASRKGSKK